MSDTSTSLAEKSTAAATILPGTPIQQSAGTDKAERGSRLLSLLERLNDPERTATALKALVDMEMQRELFEMDQRHARVFAMSGEFDDIKGETMEQSIAKAMAKIQLGRNWGFSAADSMKHVYFTNGKPAIENAVVATALARAGYGWDVDFHEVETKDKDPSGKPIRISTGCTLYLKTWNRKEGAWMPMLDRGGKQVEVSFMKADADRAVIYEKGKTMSLSDKFNYKSWAGDMYFWRAISRVKKFYAPGVLAGGMAYEETVEHEPVPEQPMIATSNAGGPGLPPGPAPTLADLVDIPIEDEPK